MTAEVSFGRKNWFFDSTVYRALDFQKDSVLKQVTIYLVKGLGAPTT